MNPYYGNPYGGNTYYPQPQMGWGLPVTGRGGYGMGGYPGGYPHSGYPQFASAGHMQIPYQGGAGGWGSVQVPLGMQSGLYSSAMSSSGISVGSSMGYNVGLYASAPAIASPKKTVPAGSRKGTVGLMLWPKEGTNELSVTGTADGTSAHTSRLEVGAPRCH